MYFTSKNHPAIEKKLRILVAPLDWGLGHATRCIPVIRHLAEKGCDVVIAAEEPAAGLLKRNFPEIAVLPLPGYRIRYSRKKSAFTFRILLQVPKILAAIRRERKWLEKILQKEHFDLVISDNRYGLYARGVFSVILTHQLQIISGRGKGIDRVLKKWHYRLLERFNACWIVDEPGAAGLGGSLSHPEILPRNSQYTGTLSQFATGPAEQKEIKGEILILLSGPEPMRGILEEKLLSQAGSLRRYHFTVVAGALHKKEATDIPPHITYHPWLTASALKEAILKSELVICRSGYSTLMDLSLLEKKALLVPTPGQTEQEYLAALLHGRGVCLFRDQQCIDLANDIPQALRFPGVPSPGKENPHKALHEAVDRMLEALGKSYSPPGNRIR